jgi:hypothetical protein
VPDISTIVVPDATSPTPVNKTFTKVKVNGDTAIFTEQSATSALGFMPLGVTVRAPLAGQKDKVYKTSIDLAYPVTTNETINGVSRPKLEYTLRARVEFTNPAESTLQNRKDLRKLTSGILNDSNVVAALEQLLNVT